MRVGLVIGLLTTVAVATSVWGWFLLGGEDAFRLSVVLPLVVCGVGGVSLRERNMGAHFGVSVTSVVFAAAVALAGPIGAAFVGMVSILLDLRPQRWRNRLFNSAMAGAIGGCGGVVYLLVAGQLAAGDLTRPSAVVLELGVPLLVAHLAMTLLNALSVGLMAAAVRGSHVLTVAAQGLRTLGWSTATHLVIGFLFVVLWRPAGLGAWSAFFILGPLVVAHWSVGREALARREHQETVTTFVAALENADPVSVGHSARVAELADEMGGFLDLEGQAAEDLRYAALLHDIGLVAVRSELPTDVDPDDIAYLSVVSGHPEAGVAVLRGMDFLTGALPAIAHHHERWDGRGYPAGLAGDAIPLAARVIAAADAFDALTAHRDGRPPVPEEEALAELRRRAGTHLDPRVVEALADALARRPRRPAPEPAPEPLVERSPPPPALAADGTGTQQRAGGWDHDHPAVSDLFAEWQPDTEALSR